MPIYEYRCQDCKRRVSIFWRTFSEAEAGDEAPVCPRCGKSNLTRLMSRVRVIRSEESRLENLADPDSLAGLEDDPRALGKMMRQMSNEMGEDMGPEFDEVINRLESGQSPEEIEKAIPDLGDDMGDLGNSVDL